MRELRLKNGSIKLFQTGTILRAELKNDGTTDYVEIICSDGVVFDLAYLTLIEFQNIYP